MLLLLVPSAEKEAVTVNRNWVWVWVWAWARVCQEEEDEEDRRHGTQYMEYGIHKDITSSPSLSLPLSLAFAL